MDIEVHRKVEVQDADITEAQQNAFKELCNEFKDYFFIDSSDIGKTPLIEMKMTLAIVCQSPKSPILFLYNMLHGYRKS